MKDEWWVTVIYIGLFALVGFLCWLFRNGWPCLALFLAPRVYWNTKD